MASFDEEFDQDFDEDLELLYIENGEVVYPENDYLSDFGIESEDNHTQSTDITKDFSKSNKGNGIKESLKYFGIISFVLIYWEVIMLVRLGGMHSSSLFVFFIPAQALFLTALCGFIGPRFSRIIMPVIMLILSLYYGVQTVYLTNFGSLFSISMLGMGNDAIGNFWWAVTDSIVSSLGIIALIILPVVVLIVFSVIDVFKLNKYKIYLHPIILIFAVIFWILAVQSVKAFGTERLSAYYMLTNSSATTDASAKKIGTLTTALVEGGSYYFGLGANEGNDFLVEEPEEIEEENSVVKAVENTVESNLSSDEDLDNAEVVTVPWQNNAIDFKIIKDSVDNEELKKLADYFASRKPSSTNEYTGMFEGYNLIYICAESFWNYACDENVTPTLYKMANNGIVLNNYYNSFYNTTTNGEFAFATSLWPDVSRHSSAGTDIGSFAQSSTKYMPQGLGDLFTSQGIPSYAFHNYYGKYYRRILSWPNLGYKCRFTGDGMYFSSNWPASDYELMQKTVDDYINDPQFHAYYMTFSGHGPYSPKNYMYNKNISEVTGIMGESYIPEARGYMAGELELDKAMEYLLERLTEAGKIDNTVIVIASDHYPYYLSAEGRDSLTGEEMDENFDIYHSNCIIYNAGMDEPLIVDNYCSNVDIAPTILNLFNIPFESRLMMGRDIFSDQAHNRAVLSNKSFITDMVKYNYETDTAEWTSEADKLSDTDKDKYIQSQINSIENEYIASCKLIDDNFFLDVYSISGLLTEEEIAEEKQREASAKAQDNSFNAEDEAEKAQREAEEAAAAAEAAAQQALDEQMQLLMQQQQMVDNQMVPQQ